MTYEKQIWADGVSPLNAERLNHMEDGIAKNAEDVTNIKESVFSKKPAVETIQIDDWERGGISSSTGAPDDNANIRRMRSEFVECKTGDVIATTGTAWIFPYFYTPGTHEFAGRADGWCKSYTVTDDMAVRLIGRIDSYIVGDIELTDETIAEFSIEVQRTVADSGELYADLVHYGSEQSLAENEQMRARANIGAASTEAVEELSDLIYQVGGIPRYIDNWQRGNLSSSTGNESSGSASIRMYTPDYINLKNGDEVILPDSNAYIFVYFYNAITHAFTKTSGSWLESYTATDDVTVRLVAKISASGASGAGDALTDVTISEFVATVNPENAERDLHLEQLPILELDGDTSAMTKDDAVTLNYKLFDQSGTCTCKWQGSSSQRYVKKNYTVKLDAPVDGWGKWAAFVNAQRAANGNVSTIPTESRWGEQKKFCTKANWIDPSHARNIVNARLWGQIVQNRVAKGEITDNRTVAPNYGAIDGFPIEIIINGESQGLYTFNIPKDGWQFAMGDSNTEYLIAGEDNYLESSRWKALAALDEEDFGLEYTADGVELDTVKTSLNNAIQAAINAGADWETTLAPYVDINSVFDYFIFACCVSNVDALARNILYGTYDGTKWFMSAYDMDTTYGTDPYNTGLYRVKTGRTEFAEAAKIHRLAYLMYTYSKEKLIARYNELRNDILSEENVWYEFSRFVADISTRNYDVDRSIWTTIPGTSLASVSQYLNYYRMHCSLLDNEIKALSQQ